MVLGDVFPRLPDDESAPGNGQLCEVPVLAARQYFCRFWIICPAVRRLNYYRNVIVSWPSQRAASSPPNPLNYPNPNPNPFCACRPAHTAQPIVPLSSTG